MRILKDVPADRLLIECTVCQRRGLYRIDRLTERFGGSRDLQAVRNALRGDCAAVPCQARLMIPLRIDVDRQTFPGNTFQVEIWESDTTIEMELAQAQGFAMAEAVFDRAVTLWPHSTVLIRLKAQVLRAHRPEEAFQRAKEALIFKRLGLR